MNRGAGFGIRDSGKGRPVGWTVALLVLVVGACKRDSGPQSDVPARPACDASSPGTLLACVDEARWTADLALIAGPRPPHTPHWQEVQDLCAERFKDLGYEVERYDFGTGIDVLGVKSGMVPEQVVLSAHYDGVEDCAAADDNGSGVAGVLEAARVLSYGRYERTLVVACWDDEENGMVGSQAWTKREQERGGTIAAGIVFEMIGFRIDAPDSQRLPPGTDVLFPEKAAWLEQRQWRGDFIAGVADTGAHEAVVALERWAATAELPILTVELPRLLLATPLAEPLHRSDHAAFWLQGYPGLMLTDTADFRNPYYHCGFGSDAVKTLDPGFAARVVRAAVGAVAELLRSR
jgi:hypothetical protein